MPVEKKKAKLRHWLVLLYSEHHSILLFLTKTSESRFVASEVFPFRLFFYSPSEIRSCGTSEIDLWSMKSAARVKSAAAQRVMGPAAGILNAALRSYE